MLNEGKAPFRISEHSGYTLEEARRQERKVMGLGLKKFKCKVPQSDFEGNPITKKEIKKLKFSSGSKVLMETRPCRKCGINIRVDAHYCPECKIYDPFITE